jgi:hypothetical protein
MGIEHLVDGCSNNRMGIEHVVDPFKQVFHFQRDIKWSTQKWVVP